MYLIPFSLKLQIPCFFYTISFLKVAAEITRVPKQIDNAGLASQQNSVFNSC